VPQFLWHLKRGLRVKTRHLLLTPVTTHPASAQVINIIKQMPSDGRLLTDTYTSPLRAQRGAAKPER
jgi:hypothetical protein